MKAFLTVASASSILLASSLVQPSQENTLKPLAEYQKQTIFLERAKAKSRYDSLVLDWLNPLNFSLTKRVSKSSSGSESETQSASLQLQQDIFRSGGIYYAVKYADAQYQSDLLGADKTEASLLKQLYSNLITLRRLEAEREKALLEIRNAEISVEIKREMFHAGASDITELNNAIMSQNSLHNALLDIEASLQGTRHTLKTLTEVAPESITVPEYKRISEEAYERLNYALRENEKALRLSDYTYKLTRASFLPKLTLNGEYGTQNIDYDDPTKRDTDGDFYSYGLTLTIPLDITTTSDLEKSRIEYLTTITQKETLKAKSQSSYQMVQSELARYERKIDVAKANRNLYSTLIQTTREAFHAGDKTKLDVEMLENSHRIETLKMTIYKQEIQNQLLHLHYGGL